MCTDKRIPIPFTPADVKTRTAFLASAMRRQQYELHSLMELSPS
jgi:hypothetical protein